MSDRDAAGRPRLLLVMPWQQLVAAAVAEGFWVGVLWDPALESADYLRGVRELADDFVLTDFSDDDGFRRAIRETAARHGVRWVYHLGRENSMPTAYEVAEELGVAPNPAPVVRLLTDKLAMRRRLAGRGLSTVSYAAAPTRADVPAALARVGCPAVIKPTALAGSRGVALCREPADVAAWAELADGYGHEGPFLVEEYLDGPEYSVETLSVAGRHHVVGITAKQLGPLPLFVEVGHVHPAPLPADRQRAIEQLTVDFLDECGYRVGPAHTEVIWTTDGPRIVESQARLGGDRIPRLVQLSSGLDIDRAVFGALAGRTPVLPPPTATAEVRFFTFPPGRVDAVHGLAEATRLPYVDELVLRLAPGDTVPVLRDSKSRQGHVLVSAATPEQARDRCEEALSLITVVIDGVPAGADGRPRTGAPA